MSKVIVLWPHDGDHNFWSTCDESDVEKITQESRFQDEPTVFIWPAKIEITVKGEIPMTRERVDSIEK